MTSTPHGKFLGGGPLVALLFSATATHAECISPGFNPSGNFCDGCRYEGVMSMTRNQACNRVYTPNPSVTSIVEFTDHRLVQRAKHGVAGLSGNTFAYMPGRDYVGPDEFTIEVLYRQQKHYGKFTVHWNVTVQ